MAAQHPGELVLELALGVEVSVLRRKAHGVAEGHAARDDRHLGDGITLGEDSLHDGVSALVIRDDLLLFFADDPAAPLRPGDDAIECLAELGHPHGFLVATGGQDRGLVDEVGDIGSRKAG